MSAPHLVKAQHTKVHAEKVVILDITAKKAYDIWAYHLGVQIPWEHVTPAERLAFQQIGEIPLDQIFECPECLGRMACSKCTAPTPAQLSEESVPVCPDCGADLLCARCAHVR
jgi:hypothetical protein